MGRLGNSIRWTKETGFRDRVFLGSGVGFCCFVAGNQGGLMAFPKKGVNPSEIYCIFEGQ